MPEEQIQFSNVLIIDANEQHRRVITGTLQRMIEGLNVTSRSPEQVVGAPGTPDMGNYDLLFLDMGEDKQALKDWFTEHVATLPPTIFLDANATPDDAVDVMRLGGADYLSKRGLKDDRLRRSLDVAATRRNSSRMEREKPDARESTGVMQSDRIRAVTTLGGTSNEPLPMPGQAGNPGNIEQDSPETPPDHSITGLDTDESSMSWFKLPAISDNFPITPEEITAGRARMGHYKILEFLGMGSNTQVFRAEDENSGELVAIKILSPSQGDKDSGSERFLREYQMVSSLDHPHIIKVIEQVIEGDWPYTVMEFCANGDLRSRIKQKIPREMAIKYAAQVASGLDAAHQKGLIHRDVKPANILIRQNHTLALVDFGIVKAKSMDEQALTDEGKMVGTPYYVSPEQARGGKLDGRSDLYSLGVILYEMMEGKKPFNGATPIDVIFSHVQDPIPSLTQEWDALNDVIRKLLAKNREERYATGREVVEALHELSPDSVDISLMN